MFFNIDDKVAVSPMPSDGDVKEFARSFGMVVAVCTDEEISYLGYDVGLWRRYGVKVLRLDVPDYRAPPLIDTYMVVKEIVDFDGRVLIHCVGGKGRSCTVAAAYLIHRYGLSDTEALERIRNVVSYAVETRAQEVFLHAYHRLLALFREDEVMAVQNVGERYEWGRGELHASYVAMLSLRLFEQLRNVLSLREEWLKPLMVASLLHDVGLALGEPHNERSYEIMLRSRKLDALGEEIKRVVALVALHHRKRGDPRQDPRCKGLEDVVARLATVLKVGDALDRSLDQVVEDVEVLEEPNALKLELYCAEGEDCEVERRKAEEKSWLLEELIRKRIEVEMV